MAQLAQCFGFDLADALAGNVELFAHFFQRVVGVHFDTEAHAQHLGFPLCQAVQDVLGHCMQAADVMPILMKMPSSEGITS